MVVGGEVVRYCAVSMGNPHCVVLCDTVSEDLALRLGPLVEVEPRFPNRTNVQFMQVLDRNAVRIYIWERGAGYTLASGSSSCAAASAAHRLGWVEAQVTVHNPGGPIRVAIAPDYSISTAGQKAYEGDGLGGLVNKTRKSALLLSAAVVLSFDHQRRVEYPAALPAHRRRSRSRNPERLSQPARCWHWLASELFCSS
jgi:hypothetical protein